MHKDQSGEGSQPATENNDVVSNDNAESGSLESVLQKSANDVPPAVSETAALPNAAPSADRTEGAATVSSDATVKRGRGRPKKEGSNTPPPGSTSPRPKLHGTNPHSNPQAINEDAAILPCAEILTMMTNASGMVLAQGEEGAMTQEEQMLVRMGYVGYLKAKGVQNVPPWVILAGSLSPYYLRIITTTKAKTTVASGLRKAWFGIKEFFIRKKDAHANRRNNPKRKDDNSEKTSETNV